MNVHGKIEPQVVVAEDGTVTLPAGVVRRAGSAAGMTPGLSEAGAHVLLRQLSTSKKMTAVEVFARVHELSPNPGPIVTNEEIDEIVAAAALERYQRSL